MLHPPAQALGTGSGSWEGDTAHSVALLWSSGEGPLQLAGETAGLSMGGAEGSRPCPEGSGVQVRHPRALGLC